MNTPKNCTVPEAVVLYRFAESGTERPVLAVDLDNAAAALCTVENGAVTTLWTCQERAPQPFFAETARRLEPQLDNASFAQALYRAAPSWRSALQQYCKTKQNFPLEPVVVNGTAVPLHCALLTEMFDAQYAEPLQKLLAQAKAYVASLPEKPQILPCGALSQFYPAEELVRKAFYSPVQVYLPVLPGLLRWSAGEDPLQAAERGGKLYAETLCSELKNTWSLSMLQRTAGGLEKTSCVLAHKGTRAEQLREVNYQQQVVAAPDEGLQLFIGQKSCRVSLPQTLFAGKPYACLQVGMGLAENEPALYIRNGEQVAVFTHRQLIGEGDA